MAALAPAKMSYQNLTPNYRPQSNNTYTGSYGASPTDSDFSVAYDDPDAVKNWSERRVSDWLKSIGHSQYIDLFRANNITGEHLLDLEQTTLKEMGIKKIGDRIRILSHAKHFRSEEHRRKRISTREFEQQNYTPPSSGSPRQPRATGSSHSLRDDRRGRGLAASTQTVSNQYATQKERSRPNSPYTDNDRVPRSGRLAGNTSAWAAAQRDYDAGYRSQPGTATRVPIPDTPQTARQMGGFMSQPQHGAAASILSKHSKGSSLSVDTVAANSGIMPTSKPWIRVIYDTGRIGIINIEGCKTAEEVILKTLKKGSLNETHVKSYCFYILDGADPEEENCRRLMDSEFLRYCDESPRRERERLMFRKIHAGKPEGPQLSAAAGLAVQHLRQDQKLQQDDRAQRSQRKIEKLTGESLPSMTFPMSPALTSLERERHYNDTARDLERPDDGQQPTPRPRPRVRNANGKDPFASRPESELIIDDVETYFPEAKEQVRRTMRESIRRSQRISRASNRLSVASNFSMVSNGSMTDAPPVPAIESRWLQASLSGRPVSHYRDSVASSMLDPLEEESPSMEPNRESYISFTDSVPESGTLDSATLNITDPEGNVVQRGLFDSAFGAQTAVAEGGSLRDELTQALENDGLEQDDELTSFLKSDGYDDIKYIKGRLIGQGSFGSVYLGLHSITAELMAVKCVELPSTAGTANDAKKNTMVEALKREIALLRELKHKHIVQYLGSSSDVSFLNIFLEYVPGGSVAKMLVEWGELPEVMIVKLIGQTLIGLAYLHSKDIIHRDIKGANILVDAHGDVKISDFGISKRVQDSKELLSEDTDTNSVKSGGGKGRAGANANRVSLQGSVFWMAPEVVKQTAYTRKADIWSLGCLIVEMLTGNHPHPTLSQLQAIFKIGGRAGSSEPSPEMPEKASAEAKDFLRQTFNVDYETRPEAEELRMHPFITQGGGDAR